jgi:HAD superfamily hydrolase (TIGR01509 family)
MRTRWIICDLGKVLVDFEHRSIARRLEALLAARHPGVASPGEAALLDLLFRPRGESGRSFNALLDRGEADIADVAAALAEELGVALPPEDLEPVWAAIFRETHPGMIRFLVAARHAGARLALCSNTNRAHWQHIEAHYPELRLGWDALFLSFRMGIAKTDAGFFDRVAKSSGCAAGELFFVDDLQENVDAAASAGLRVFLYRGVAPTLAEAGLG